MKDWAMEHWFITFAIIVISITAIENTLKAYFNSRCCDECHHDEDDQSHEEEIDKDKSSKSS